MPRRGSPKKWTYARAGVDASRRGRALAALLRRVQAPSGKGARSSASLLGHYAGFVRAGSETIAVTTDTVGTKVLLAEAMHRFTEVGEDLVAINVNDLAAVGSRPIGIVDSISCVDADPRVFAGLGVGIDRGLRAADCRLLGGETAIVPELVTGLDLGGTAIGYFPEGRRPVTGDRIRAGDVILGLPASGFHSNGFTLIRRLLKEARIPLSHRRKGGHGPVGIELLTPTRSYVRASEALADDPRTHGLAHITGGGVRNLVRLNRRVRFELNGWPAPYGIYAWLGALGDLDPTELYQTFNMGIGFVAVVDPSSEEEMLRRLGRAGYPDALRVGIIARGRGVTVPGMDLRYQNYA
jgi:phosphoribosylformylglycinamidine cyclo-ligase